MMVRFKYSSREAAEHARQKLPISCEGRVLTDRTKNAYLEVPESYEDYVERYLTEK